MNSDIKQTMKTNFVPQWKVADRLGISEMTLIRWLRKELPEGKRLQIMQAIEQLKKEQESKS